MKTLTLVMMLKEKERQVLLGMKQRGFGVGRWTFFDRWSAQGKCALQSRSSHRFSRLGVLTKVLVQRLLPELTSATEAIFSGRHEIQAPLHRFGLGSCSGKMFPICSWKIEVAETLGVNGSSLRSMRHILLLLPSRAKRKSRLMTHVISQPA